MNKPNVASIIEQLENNPQAILISTDDVMCKAILSTLGMLDSLSKKSDAPGYTVAQTDHHKTHFVVAIYWFGHLLPQENGYQVFCLPKCHTSKEQLAEFARFIVDRTGGHDRKDSVLVLPGYWRRNN